MSNSYLDWVIGNTRTKWWHDSADAAELDLGLERGAVGVTTNPFLSNAAMKSSRPAWSSEIEAVLARQLPPDQQAETLMHIAVTKAAQKLLPQFQASGGASGFVCSQVNPVRAGDRECMHAMARRFHTWSPNIAVKLPATAAGLDVLEECVAEGITCTATVSFTVPQVLAVADRHRAGMQRARFNGIEPGKCFAVIMIGRLDDYLREVAADNRAAIDETDIQQAGLAVAKRAYSIYRERGYDAVLLVAALRGSYHLTELAGADLVMSIHPSWQGPFITRDFPREERIANPVPAAVVNRLLGMREFQRAYEPDGMTPEEFVTFGVTQRTLGQFSEMGWKPMETLR